MSKQSDIQELVKLLSNDPIEQHRLITHHSKRSAEDVADSLARQRSIANVSQSEISKHCQFPKPIK